MVKTGQCPKDGQGKSGDKVWQMPIYTKAWEL